MIPSFERVQVVGKWNIGEKVDCTKTRQNERDEWVKTLDIKQTGGRMTRVSGGSGEEGIQFVSLD